ncbi:hypothetical protein GUJ93_ZPchr0013g35564 [Zizania palustris]|uniref:Uncharacterized protein n=1 Tax=Zizania palustris TaxID=103762 RepID=A0A8J5X1R1_ZIZPA|nr:hypothetical protein GUJ93_ZPchr0013g35564 [Zizania palustris]
MCGRGIWTYGLRDGEHDGEIDDEVVLQVADGDLIGDTETSLSWPIKTQELLTVPVDHDVVVASVEDASWRP